MRSFCALSVWRLSSTFFYNCVLFSITVYYLYRDLLVAIGGPSTLLIGLLALRLLCNDFLRLNPRVRFEKY